MSTLIVGNGYRASLSGLGRNRGLQNLSQTRVSKAVREALRQQYGETNVSVGCEPELVSGGWHGLCTVHGEGFGYKITA